MIINLFQEKELTEEEIKKRAEEIHRFYPKGSDQANWYAAIESLKKERTINGKLERISTHPHRLTKKVLAPFRNHKHRFFALETTKAIISALSLTATVVAGIGLFLNYNNANERLITERFSKAIEQLGSDKIEIRLGGIYALERISKDSKRDYETVIEILTAFVRENSKLPPQKSQAPTQAKNIKQFSSPSTDIQAVLTVLGRRTDPSSEEKISLDLGKTNLTGAYLRGAYLQGANFRGAKLQDADFGYANLQGADLLHANLQDAFLLDANLQGAYLQEANLSKALLQRAKLQGANLLDAKLHKAQLTEAQLLEANFKGANFQEAFLFEANLTGTNLTGVNFQKAYLDSANLQKADLKSANFRGASFGCYTYIDDTKFSCTNFRGVKNITPEQIKKAKNWQAACYDLNFRIKLGLVLQNPKRCAGEPT